jgi:hypothetical protein
MPDNLQTQAATLASLPANTGIASRAVTYSGDANQYIGPTGLVTFGGADDAKTATDVPLPTALGANGGIKVDIVGDTGQQSALDTDDGSIAAGQALIALVLSEHLTFDGAAWVRGGWTPNTLVSAATNNATSLKATPGVVGMITASNNNASPRYLKFYNKASAPAPASDTPVLVIEIPGNAAGAGSNIPIPMQGIKFSVGIAYAIVAGIANNDNTAVGASEVAINIAYL